MRILSHIRSIIPVAAISAAGICLASLSSCERYVLPELSFEPDTLLFSAQGGTLPVMLHANVNWSLSTDSNWLEPDTTYGDSDCTIVFIAVPNTDGARKTTADFKSETIKRSLVILQEGEISED